MSKCTYCDGTKNASVMDGRGTTENACRHCKGTGECIGACRRCREQKPELVVKLDEGARELVALVAPHMQKMNANDFKASSEVRSTTTDTEYIVEFKVKVKKKREPEIRTDWSGDTLT